MKIAVLGLRGFPGVPGGVENHCEHLYPRIVRLGGEVTVFTRSCHIDPEIREHNGVALIPIPCPRQTSLEAMVHTFLGVIRARLHHPDILHFHAVGPALFVPLARLLGMRVVMTNHGPDYDRKKWGGFARMVLKLGERLGSRYAHEIICISPHIAASVRERYGRETHIIPNGIELPVCDGRDDTLRRFGLEAGKYVLAVGRLVPEKGFDDLIEAFVRARPEGWKLAIVGRADHEGAYSRALIRRAAAEPGVVMTGFLTGPPLREVYSRAGLFVLPSYHEGLPIVLLEAMSYGLSCVVSDIPANRSVPLNNDRFFPPGDIRALTERLDSFVVQPLTPGERERQIKLVRKCYDWDDIARKTRSVYLKVLNPSANTGVPVVNGLTGEFPSSGNPPS